MCMGIPARVVSVGLSDGLSRPAILESNDGTEMTADLAMVPRAKPGDYVVTHSGLAISLLTEDEARRVFGLHREMKEGDIQTTAR